MNCHVDGELRPVERAVSAADRGLLYGDAAVERLRAVGGDPVRWDAHRERLIASCESLGIDPPADLRERIVATLRANELPEALVRVSIARGTGETTPARDGATDDDRTSDAGHTSDRSGLTPPATATPTVLITTEPIASIRQAGSEPATLQTVKTKPIPADSIPERARSPCQLDRVLARRELVADADEAIMTTREGTVADCAGSSLLVVAADSVRVPPAGDAVPRVMRTVALECARSEGIPVAAADLTPADVRDAEEVLLASARWGVRPVATVDGIDVGPGPVATLLNRLVADAIGAESGARGSRVEESSATGPQAADSTDLE